MKDLMLYDMTKDYYIPKTREEILKELKFYKSFVKHVSRGHYEQNIELYGLIYRLINLKISAFDVEFNGLSLPVPSILNESLKYNVWNITNNTVEKFNNKNITFNKRENSKAVVSVFDVPVVEMSLQPENYVFLTPSIDIYCYETDYEYASYRLNEERKKYFHLKDKIRECRFFEIYGQYNTEEEQEKLNNILENHIKLTDDLENARKELNFYRKHLCMYREPLYKEVAYALLEEYHVADKVGKTYTKTLPWITLRRKSL